MDADQHASLQLSLQKSILHHYRVIGTSDMQLTCSIAGSVTKQLSIGSHVNHP